MSSRSCAPIERRARALGRMASAALLLLVAAEAGDAAAQPTPDSLLSGINADIRDGVWFERGYLVLTPELALTAGNQLQLKAVACRYQGNPDAVFIASCRSGDAADLARTTVTIDPKGLDPGAVRVRTGTGSTYQMAFACRAGTPCLTLANGSRKVDHGGLVCNDAAACGRVMRDFKSLVALLLASPAPEARGDSVDSLLARVNQRIGKGVWLREDTAELTTKVELQPGGKLLIRNTGCAMGTPDPDPGDLEECWSGSDVLAVDDDELVTAADIDPDAIYIDASDRNRPERGFAVHFQCRKGRLCVEDPADKKSFSKGGLICNDLAACNQLGVEFAALVALVAKAGP